MSLRESLHLLPLTCLCVFLPANSLEDKNNILTFSAKYLLHKEVCLFSHVAS